MYIEIVVAFFVFWMPNIGSPNYDAFLVIFFFFFCVRKDQLKHTHTQKMTNTNLVKTTSNRTI